MPLEPEESLVRTKPCQGRINIELITCVIILFPTFTLGKALGPGATAAPMRIEEVAGSQPKMGCCCLIIGFCHNH